MHIWIRRLNIRLVLMFLVDGSASLNAEYGERGFTWRSWSSWRSQTASLLKRGIRIK